MPNSPSKTAERAWLEVVALGWITNLALHFIETCGQSRWAYYGRLAIILIFALGLQRATVRRGQPSFRKLAPALAVMLTLGLVLQSVFTAKCRVTPPPRAVSTRAD